MDRTQDTPVVVVGLDGSATAEVALRWAVELVKATGAELRLVHAWQREILLVGVDMTQPVPGWDDYGRQWEAQASAELQEAVDRVAGLGLSTGVTTRLDEGSPTAVLVREGRGAAAVVVGSHGRGGVDRMLLGSVSDTVATRAACPVFVVRADPERNTWPMRRVVVGVDGSEASADVMRLAAAQARLQGAELTVVTVWPQPTGWISETWHEVADEAERQERGRALIARVLDAAGPIASALDPVQLVLEGPAALRLVEAARRDALLVVGAHGHGALDLGPLALGSTTRAVLHRAMGPVLVAR